MSRLLRSLLSLCAIFLATSQASAVILGQFGPGGTYHAYRLDRTTKTWDQARFDALGSSYMSVPGTLTSIHSAAQNTFLNRIGTGDRWIGLTDHDLTNGGTASSLDGFTGNGASEAGSNRNGNWRWVDSTPYDFQSWNGGEPNNSGQTATSPGEDAIHFTGTGGLWNDNNAGATLGDLSGVTNFQSLREYKVGVSGNEAWKVTVIKVQDVQLAGVTVGNLAEAKQVIAGTRGPLEPSFNGGAPLTQAISTVNFVNPHPGSAGFIAGDAALPGLAASSDNYVIMAMGNFTPTTGGVYTFGVNSDDGFGLLIRDANTNAIVGFTDWSGQSGTGLVGGELQFAGGRGASNAPATNAVASYGRVNLNPGTSYKYELVHWEGTGGTASLESYWMLGTPTDYAPNATGTNLSFSDGAWTLLGAAGDLASAGNFTATSYKLRNQINYPDITTMAQADQVLAGTFGAPTATGFPQMVLYDVINMHDSGANVGNFGGDDPVFGGFLGTDDFVVDATGLVFIPQAGIWTFAINADDGTRLIIDGNTVHNTNGTTNSAFINVPLTSGWHDFRYTWFERSGDARGELAAAFNPTGAVITAFGQLPFQLIGDRANGGLLVQQQIIIPEPATAALGLLALAGLAMRRRRAA